MSVSGCELPPEVAGSPEAGAAATDTVSSPPEASDASAAGPDDSAPAPATGEPAPGGTRAPDAVPADSPSVFQTLPGTARSPASRDAGGEASSAGDSQGADESTDTTGEPAGGTVPARPPLAPQIRQGPFRVTCFHDNEIVFEHDRIYRVWQPQAQPPQWAYETADGVRFRGRMGTGINCIWDRR